MDETRHFILSRRARFMALAVSFCTTACDRWASVCLSMPPDCDAGADAPSPGMHVVSPRKVCSGGRAALKAGYYGCGSWASVSPAEVKYESDDPSVLRIDGAEAVGVAPGHVTVHVEWIDGSGGGSADIEVVRCDDGGTDGGDDASDGGEASDSADAAGDATLD